MGKQFAHSNLSILHLNKIFGPQVECLHRKTFWSPRGYKAKSRPPLWCAWDAGIAFALHSSCHGLDQPPQSPRLQKPFQGCLRWSQRCATSSETHPWGSFTWCALAIILPFSAASVEGRRAFFGLWVSGSHTSWTVYCCDFRLAQNRDTKKDDHSWLPGKSCSVTITPFSW